ncbi:MAG: RNA polymerase sigma factor [Planctomycetes bacterium]|nr:RNA polymerase sigma factor [Planctomycetota bacterium]
MSPEGSRAPGPFTRPEDPPAAAPRAGEAPGGARAAFEDLVHQNMGWLLGWLRGRVRDPELAHDICQESFLKALRSAAFLKDPARFPGWLYQIAKNTLRDHLRRKARRRRWFLFADSEYLDALEAPGRSDPVETSEEAESMLRAIRELPPRYREPLLLRHSRDLSYAEIGAILGISENAVQVRIFRARKTLRERERQRHR